MSGPERRGEVDEQHKSTHEFGTGKLRVPSFLEMVLLASRIRDKPTNFQLEVGCVGEAADRASAQQ